MKNKEFYCQAVGTDKDGIEHRIVVCGLWSQTKTPIEVTDKIVIDKKYQGIASYQKKIPVKVFSIGYAICSPEDTFDYGEGKKIAKKRALKEPIGTLGTYNFTMLNSDQCNALILAESLHISKNLEKYINKDKK